MSFRITFNKKGQIAILTVLLLLVVILAVSAGLITMTLREMKMARNVAESARAFAAADAGIDHILAILAVDGTPSQYLCADSEWRDLMTEPGQESYYCIGVIPYIDEGYYSIGRSGNVRRAIFAPAPSSLDQSSMILGENKGHTLCTCISNQPMGPPSLKDLGKQAAQTFTAGRDGQLFAATVYMAIDSINNIEQVNLRAEIRDIDPGYSDDFYPLAAKPGDMVIASTTPPGERAIFTPGEMSNIKCDPKDNCQYITFHFDPPATTTAGVRYTLLVEGLGSGIGINSLHWGACCTERRYYPGKGWHRQDPADPWNDTFGPQNHRFDYDFKVYILADPSGEFEEGFPW